MALQNRPTDSTRAFGAFVTIEFSGDLDDIEIEDNAGADGLVWRSRLVVRDVDDFHFISPHFSSPHHDRLIANSATIRSSKALLTASRARSISAPFPRVCRLCRHRQNCSHRALTL